MNISNYINKLKKTHKYNADNYETHVNLYEQLISNDGFYIDHLVINVPVYSFTTCSFKSVINLDVKNTISTNGYLFISYWKINPGSFVENRIMDGTTPHINSLKINGYIMNSGVLS